MVEICENKEENNMLRSVLTEFHPLHKHRIFLKRPACIHDFLIAAVVVLYR